MITVTNLSYEFPQKELYKDISFELEDNCHCAFIGTNGTGKSTLVKMLLDPYSYLYDGKITIAENARTGFVCQFPSIEKDETVFEYIAKEFLILEKEIADLCTQMESGENLDVIFALYQEKLDLFDAIGGNDYTNRIQKNLNLANLNEKEHANLSTLSSGELKLIQVIKEMLSTPNLLIMDEPDAYLDFIHQVSLKELIHSYKGTLLVITHNRYLLNHCFNKILQLEGTRLQEFNGTYQEYQLTLLDYKIDLQEKAIASEAEIERNIQVVEKFRAAATYYVDAARGRALKGRVSILKRLLANQVMSPFIEVKKPRISLTKEPFDSTCNETLEVTDLTIGYHEPLLESVSFTIGPKEKIALIGDNGIGKSTLLRTLMKQEQDGILFSSDTILGTLSQDANDVFNVENTVYQEFLNYDFVNETEIMAHLAPYGFEDSILTQKISQLSGGEITMLQLAKIGTTNTNFLLLDEPTSHLDLYSQIAFEEAINQFSGSVLLVSHDFYTISNCVDSVLIIEDKGIRKVRMRTFRKKIYETYFKQGYLEAERIRIDLELEINQALLAKDCEKARLLFEKLVEYV
ncbi:MAG: ABC-F family ATP-binding cassette domain-containing protein [Lachnospiraceae bacterium]